MKSKNNDSFILHTSQYEAIRELSVEDKAALLDAIYMYAIGDKVENLSGAVGMAFSFIRIRIDEDLKHYNEVCEKRKNAGQKGGRPKKPNGLEEKQKNQMVFGKPNETKKNKSNQKKLSDTDSNTDTDTKFSIENNNNTPNPPKGGISPTSILKIDFDKLMNYWNLKMKDSPIPKIQKMTDGRKKAVLGLLKQYTKNQLAMAIDKAATSRFMNGGNERGWIATFDWILKPAKFIKVLEGSFDDRTNLAPMMDEAERRRIDRMNGAANIVKSLLEKEDEDLEMQLSLRRVSGEV